MQVSTHFLILSCAFGLGTLAQALLLLRKEFFSSKLLLAIGVGIFGLILGKKEGDYNLPFHVFQCFLFFGAILAGSFRDKILPSISERNIIQLSIIFIYSLVVSTPYLSLFNPSFLNSKYFQSSGMLKLLIAVPLSLPVVIPVVIGLGLIFWRGKLTERLEVGAYLYFLLLNILLLSISFSFGNLKLFFAFDPTSFSLTLTESFFTGMATLYLIVYSILFLFSLPYKRSKRQSWEDRQRELREYLKLIRDKYADDDMPVLRRVLTLAFTVLVLGANYHFHWLADSLVINVLIVLDGIISGVVRPRPATVSA